MKKILLFSFLLLIAARGFSQQFSQYNTGTLYDSFENPSQRSFIPDSSKQFASNFFVPNINASFFLTGDIQSTLINREFGGKYVDNNLIIGQGKYNQFNVDAGNYDIMFKLFGSLKGNSEWGIFVATKMEGKGSFTDESIAALNGPGAFPNSVYDNVFNDHEYYQIYNDIGVSYREQVTPKLALGVKLGMLLGVDYNKLDINQSHISFDNVSNTETVSLAGKYYKSQGPGNFDGQSFLPNTRSSGVQLSLGSSYKTEDHITLQFNLKDLGFIHWYNNSTIANFSGTELITGTTSAKRETNLVNGALQILNFNKGLASFTSATNSKFEISASKTYFVDDDKTIKYIPTLIASKELLYSGFTGAFVNRFQYQNYNVSLTGTYDNLNLFNLGLQFMIKSANGEFFIGSDKLTQSLSLLSASHNYASYTNGSFTGASFFLGFSLKFGQVIEHPLNASTIPTGERGFLGRLYNRLFKTYW